MEKSNQFKKNIEKIIGQSRKIKFKGDNFDICVSLLSKKKEKEIYKWVENVLDRKIIGTYVRYKFKIYRKL